MDNRLNPHDLRCMSTRCVLHRLLNNLGMILFYRFAVFSFEPQRIECLDCSMVIWVLARFKGDLCRRRCLIVLDRFFRCGLSLAIDAPLEEISGIGIVYLAREMRYTEVTGGNIVFVSPTEINS